MSTFPFGIPDFGDASFADGTAPVGGSGSPSGAGGGSGSGAPIINSFTASTGTSTPNASVLLSADVTGAITLTVSPDFGIVIAWPITVNPVTTTTYTLTATNLAGSRTASLTILIRGASSENVRYHQIRRNDRQGDGKQLQMSADGNPATNGWVALYDASGNVIASQPRGNTTVAQLADQTGGYVENDLLAFDAQGNAKDSGISVAAVLQNGANDDWYQQIPVGTKNGSNTSFALDYTMANPYAILALNGAVQNPYGEYNITGKTTAPIVHYAVPPQSGDWHVIWYFRDKGVGPTDISSATLNVWAAFRSADGTAHAFADSTWHSADGGSSFNVYRTNILVGLTQYTHSMTLPANPTTSSFAGSNVTFLLDGSLPATGDNYIDIYDVYIACTLVSDGSIVNVRPTTYGFYDGTGEGARSWQALTNYASASLVIDTNGNKQLASNTGTSGYNVPNWSTSGNTVDGSMIWTFDGPQTSITGKITNPGFAYDDENAPPATFATFTRNFYNGFAVGGTFAVLF
jgi:hypothetical protein